VIYALAVLAIGAFGFATTAIALAIRQAGLREDRIRLTDRLRDSRIALEASIEETQLTRSTLGEENRMLRGRLAKMRERINALPDTDDNRNLLLGELDVLLQGSGTNNRDQD
jgi:predicted nuclease with TOPRIM domain